MIKYFFFLLATAFFIFSCNIENKKPEFKRIENVQIKDFTAQNIEITADAIIFNPNPISIFLINTELDVFANEIKVSQISQTKNTEITKKSEFTIPLIAKFKLQDLLKDEASIMDIISSSLNTYKDKKINMKYIGKATFKVAGISFDVPIEQEEIVELK